MMHRPSDHESMRADAPASQGRRQMHFHISLLQLAQASEGFAGGAVSQGSRGADAAGHGAGAEQKLELGQATCLVGGPTIAGNPPETRWPAQGSTAGCFNT